jgi:hypothetical protein
VVPTVCFWYSCVSCILKCNICLSVLFAVPVNHGCANNMKKIRSCLLVTFRLHCYGSIPIACATLYCRWLLLNFHFSNLDFMSMVQLFSLVFRCRLPWPCGRPMATVHFLPDHIHICPVKLEPGFFYIIWSSSHILHSFGVKGYFLFLALLQCVDSSADLFLTFHLDGDSQLIDGAVQPIVEPVTEY